MSNQPLMHELQSIHENYMRRIKRVFFIGIGGSGMNGIAEVMLNSGFSVAGSDVRASEVTERLQALGARVYIGHAAEHVENMDAVVVSSAIAADNVEVVRARELGIPLVKRAEMLAELMRFRHGIAVAGTHGKTTTTSLVAWMLSDAGLDPTYVIGGVLNASGRNACLGRGPYLVAEADESDASFLRLYPLITIVTNIDEDHLETYHDSFTELKNAFKHYIHNLPFYGLAVVCLDNAPLREMLPDISRPLVTYGFDPKADYTAENVRQIGLQMHFDWVDHLHDQRYPVVLNIPGRHNVLNALAAIAVAVELDIDFERIRRALRSFKGVGRRFNHQGRVPLPQGGEVDIFDDYGHHPTEIKAVLDAARAGFDQRRIVTVFQPHRYSRTFDLMDEFANLLSDCECVLLTDVYPAGEQPIKGGDSKALVRAIRARHTVEPVLVSDLDELNRRIVNVLRDDDVVIYFGAGNISRYAASLARDMRAAAQGAQNAAS